MLVVRPRVAEDVPACLALLSAVNAADGYPFVWPDDTAKWLCPRGFREAWLAVDGDRVLGHVLIRDDRPGSDGSAVELGRLFVHPAARRQGVAVRLMQTCREWAAQAGLDLVLTVIEGTPAVGLYEATGWRYTGSEVPEWTRPSGEPVTLLRYRLVSR